ncbi:MAG TPA: response regulator [Acidobacteriota bacterium]|nr:response regulator [Acidobacteriota bacterium]
MSYPLPQQVESERAPSRPPSTGEQVRVLIVDDEEHICELLQEAMESWGFQTQVLSSPLQLEDLLHRSDPFDLVMLDLCMPGVSGLELIPVIREHSPRSKILVVTGMANKDSVVHVLREGAFDFIEKPFSFEFLRHRVEQALDAMRSEKQRRRSLRELRQSRESLFRKTQQLRRANQELQDANTALSVLAHNIEKSREESEQRIVNRLRHLTQPVREWLETKQGLKGVAAEFAALLDYVDDLAKGGGDDLDISSALSQTEYRVATMVRKGLTSKEVANHLGVSVDTVKTHRRNIRRKLDLAGTGSNLQTYLQQKL